VPFVKLGRYTRFSAAELEVWWQSRRRGPWRTNSLIRLEAPMDDDHETDALLKKLLRELREQQQTDASTYMNAKLRRQPANEAEARALAADQAGLPPTAAARLVGDSFEELEADAQALAASVQPTAPQTSFDGDAHEQRPEPANPGMNSLLRAHKDQRHADVTRDALHYDKEQ